MKVFITFIKNEVYEKKFTLINVLKKQKFPNYFSELKFNFMGKGIIK